MIQLTSLTTNDPLYIAKDQIQIVYESVVDPPVEGFTRPRACSVFIRNCGVWEVRESVGEILEKMNVVAS